MCAITRSGHDVEDCASRFKCLNVNLDLRASPSADIAEEGRKSCDDMVAAMQTLFWLCRQENHDGSLIPHQYILGFVIDSKYSVLLTPICMESSF